MVVDQVQKAGGRTPGHIGLGPPRRVHTGGDDLPPAVWHIDADGDFPPGDPVDQGLPSFSREVEPMGFNDAGVGVGWNRRANQMDDQGNWVFLVRSWKR